MASPPCRAAAVAISTNDLALFNLREKSRPAPVSYAISDAEILTTDVIELENEDIWFAAINARMRTEKLNEVVPSLLDLAPRYCSGPFDISLPICCVVLAVILGLA
jgi:hypothetical protein